jgi:translation initiation factor 2 beta subunit (eIF-2beta)/eIF-5|tara:strand:+ start:837 stop:1028 length:192 start_codon:yes stop_codon:yes gene_type:complete
MSDQCCFCEGRIPTNHLVLNGGELWLEFCKECGETETITNAETEETFSVSEVFNQAKKEHNEK